MKVAIDARVEPGISGGVAPFVRNLVYSLGRLTDGNEEYVIVVASRKQRAWLEPFLGPNQRLLVYVPVASPGPRGVWRALLSLRPAVRYMRRLMDSRVWPEVPLSDGFFEHLGCDALHITVQPFSVCALPTIYNPHDLQHLHYPQYSDAQTIAWRETVYRAGCDFAHTVVVGSQWIKEDVVRHYRIAPDKVQVIPEAAWTESFVEPTEQRMATVKARHGIEQPFALYPGVTWPHKNHIRLLDALARLRDERGLTVHLVCTGAPYEGFWPRIEGRLAALRLARQVKFLGYVPDEDLRALYRLATCLVMPTLFEAISLPIFEAWSEGLPVVCSNVTALPEQVRDAASLFDPNDTASIADAVAAVMTNVALQQELRTRGYQRVKDFDWPRTAKAYRAVYRRAAGQPLTDEDRWLLQWNWMREPQRQEELRLQ